MLVLVWTKILILIPCPGSKLRLVKRGVKEVVKSLKKGEKGYVIPVFIVSPGLCELVSLRRVPPRILVLAGDITPLDIISHLPLLAEEASVPYIFVASKEELGHASATKRPTSCVLVCPEAKVKRKKDLENIKEEEEEFKSSYSKCFAEVKDLVSFLPRSCLFIV